VAGLQRRILLAEDSADNVFLVKAYLKDTGCELDCATNGREAVEMFRSGRYDIVLMDVQMPEMDGYTATRAIREWEREQARTPVPVVALTAHALRDEPERARAAGCTLHVSKPVRKATLLQVIEEHAPHGRREAAHLPPEIRELVPGYLQARREEVPVLQEALARGDFETVRRLGHNLKGTGSGYGYPELTALGSRLQEAAAEADLGRLRESLAGLEAFLRRAKAV
jgi:CheY-like chemotaxis protein